jgi:hypothetical protein
LQDVGRRVQGRRRPRGSWLLGSRVSLLREGGRRLREETRLCPRLSLDSSGNQESPRCSTRSSPCLFRFEGIERTNPKRGKATHVPCHYDERQPLRGGIGISARAESASNNSLSVGRADSSSLRQVSNATKTAASTPPRVTTCGPSVRLASSSSLKRAFASCTGQRFVFRFRGHLLKSSHLTSQVNMRVAQRVRLRHSSKAPCGIRSAHGDERTSSRQARASLGSQSPQPGGS